MARKKLKLFVWEGVLQDYTCGIIFALAEDVDEARRLILSKDDLPSVQRDIKAEPDVYDPFAGDKMAFLVWGGG